MSLWSRGALEVELRVDFGRMDAAGLLTGLLALIVHASWATDPGAVGSPVPLLLEKVFVGPFEAPPGGQPTELLSALVRKTPAPQDLERVIGWLGLDGNAERGLRTVFLAALQEVPALFLRGKSNWGARGEIVLDRLLGEAAQDLARALLGSPGTSSDA